MGEAGNGKLDGGQSPNASFQKKKHPKFKDDTTISDIRQIELDQSPRNRSGSSDEENVFSDELY